MPTPIFVIDGGLGTTLEDQFGIKFTSDQTPLWSSHLLLSEEGRTTLLKCHKKFATAPVDILTTATYQLSTEGLARTRDLEHPNGYPASDIPSIVSTAVNCTLDALLMSGNAGAAIALSLGPYGSTMIPSTEYSGAYLPPEFNDITALRDWHAERIAYFLDDKDVISNVRHISFETIPRLNEVHAIRSAMNNSSSILVSAGIPGSAATKLTRSTYWMSCVVVGDDNRLPDGSTITEIADAALSLEYSPLSPWGIGVNCCKAHKLPDIVAELTEAVETLVSKGKVSGGWPSLVIYPDGTNGEVYDTVTQTWKKPDGIASPTDMSWAQRVADVAMQAADLGKWHEIVVGGCCKATPEDIKELSERLAERRKQRDVARGLWGGRYDDTTLNVELKTE